MSDTKNCNRNSNKNFEFKSLKLNDISKITLTIN